MVKVTIEDRGVETTREYDTLEQAATEIGTEIENDNEYGDEANPRYGDTIIATDEKGREYVLVEENGIFTWDAC